MIEVAFCHCFLSKSIYKKTVISEKDDLVIVLIFKKAVIYPHTVGIRLHAITLLKLQY